MLSEFIQEWLTSVSMWAWKFLSDREHQAGFLCLLCGTLRSRGTGKYLEKVSLLQYIPRAFEGLNMATYSAYLFLKMTGKKVYLIKPPNSNKHRDLKLENWIALIKVQNEAKQGGNTIIYCNVWSIIFHCRWFQMVFSAALMSISNSAPLCNRWLQSECPASVQYGVHTLPFILKQCITFVTSVS